MEHNLALIALETKLDEVKTFPKHVFWPKKQPLPDKALRQFLANHFAKQGLTLRFYTERRDGGFVTLSE